MDIFDAYEMDDEALEKGIWGDLVVGGTTIGRIRCRPNDGDLNTEYRKALATAGVAYAVLQEKGATDDKLAQAKEDMAVGLLVDTVLTDWELYQTVKSGKSKGKEKPIPFSKKKATELLKKLPKLRAAVETLASGWTKFRKGRVDETVKI